LFPRRSIVDAWKPTTAEEIYNLLGLFMLWVLFKSLLIFQHQKNDSYTGFLRHHNERDWNYCANFYIFLTMKARTPTKDHQSYSRFFLSFPTSVKKFQTLYLPYQNISVDESLTLWRGRLSNSSFL
jgi:hypothetical protein